MGTCIVAEVRARTQTDHPLQAAKRLQATLTFRGTGRIVNDLADSMLVSALALGRRPVPTQRHCA